jgi:hypothetical protein
MNAVVHNKRRFSSSLPHYSSEAGVGEVEQLLPRSFGDIAFQEWQEVAAIELGLEGVASMFTSRTM